MVGDWPVLGLAVPGLTNSSRGHRATVGCSRVIGVNWERLGVVGLDWGQSGLIGIRRSWLASTWVGHTPLGMVGFGWRPFGLVGALSGGYKNESGFA